MRFYFKIYVITVILLVIFGVVRSLDAFIGFNFWLIVFIIYIHLPKPTKAQIRSRNAARRREHEKNLVNARKDARLQKKADKENALEIYRNNKPSRNTCGYGLSTAKRFN